MENTLSKINNLFKNFTVIKNSTILSGIIPKEILDELNNFVIECNKVKNSKLGFLKNHINLGHNSYQCSIPFSLLSNSLIFPYLNHLGERYYSFISNEPLLNLYRRVVVRENRGHFDGFDIWINYSTKDNFNPPHTHGGTLSGVIYIDNNSNLPTIFPDHNIEHIGFPGSIILFPSSFTHLVPIQKDEKERITIAFNLDLV